MTLKEFAEQNGLNPSTARVWLKREKIVKRGETFQFADKVKRENVTTETQSETFQCNAELETLEAQVKHWQARFNSQQAENDSLKMRLEIAQREILDLRAQIVNDSVSEEIEIDSDGRLRFGWREFVDKCCAVGKRITGEESNRAGIEDTLRRKLKIQPDAMMSVPVAALDKFSRYVESVYA